jgi:hypothetical protein
LIVREARYNMAYWNLHERKLSGKPGNWIVNGQDPLGFYHFSGIEVDSPKQISKHQNRFDLISRPDLNGIFADYRQRLRDAGAAEFRKRSYSFGTYSSGEPITSIARRAYAAHLDAFRGTDPFDVSGPYYKWSKKRRLLGAKDTSGPMTSLNLDSSDIRLKLIHWGMRLALRILGTDRYTALMKYFSWISILRNQIEVFGQVSPEETQIKSMHQIAVASDSKRK